MSVIKEIFVGMCVTKKTQKTNKNYKKSSTNTTLCISTILEPACVLFRFFPQIPPSWITFSTISHPSCPKHSLSSVNHLLSSGRLSFIDKSFSRILTANHIPTNPSFPQTNSISHHFSPRHKILLFCGFIFWSSGNKLVVLFNWDVSKNI